MTKSYKRTRKIIQPSLQLRLVGLFTGVGTLALLLQFLVVGFRLMQVAAKAEGTGGHIADEIPGILVQTLIFSMGMLVPVIFGFGILLTFRIAGPAHRMEQYLLSIARGEQPGECSIRKGDKLQSLCDAMNAAITRLRQKTADTPTQTEEVRPPAKKAA